MRVYRYHARWLQLLCESNIRGGLSQADHQRRTTRSPLAPYGRNSQPEASSCRDVTRSVDWHLSFAVAHSATKTGIELSKRTSRAGVRRSKRAAPRHAASRRTGSRDADARSDSSRRPGATSAAKPAAQSSSRAEIFVTSRDKLAGEWFAKLVALQARLRGGNGCPWDREQTHASLRKFLIEEAYEVLDAMDSGDPRKFASEMGDLLLQVVFHSILAEETGAFTISDVIESVHEKMVRRHPHVFGDAVANTSGAVLKNWEQIKAEERAKEKRTAEKNSGKRPAKKAAADKSFESILSGVPRSLPAVLEAYQLTRRAAHVGFDWENLGGVLDKLDEERREIESTLAAGAASGPKPGRRKSGEHEAGQQKPGQQARHLPSAHLEEEVGDLLFVGVNIARFLGVDPEIALRKANKKFKGRFEWMESAAARRGQKFTDLPRERMEELWDRSKARE
jgi:MazG family protein